MIYCSGKRCFALNSSRKYQIIIGLLLCMGVSTILQTYFSSALPVISTTFRSIDFYSWIHGSYILASSSVIILSSGLCHKFGYLKNFSIGSLLFGIGTLVALFSTSMLQLVIARIIMGIGAGAVVPATYGIINEYFEKDKYTSIFASFAIVQIIFSGLGSLAGGYLPQAFSWQAIFYFLIPIQLLSFLFVFRNLPKHITNLPSIPFPIRQHLIMIIAVLLTAVGIEQAYHQRFLWLTFGILSLLFLLRKPKKMNVTLLPKQFMTDSLLKNLCLQAFLLGAFYNVCLVYLPSFMQFSLNLNANSSGNYLEIFVVFMGVGSGLGGLIKTPNRIVILISWLICFAGCSFIGIIFSLAVLLLGLGSGILMSVLLGYIAFCTQEDAAGVNSTAHLIRNFGGSIGTISFQYSLNYSLGYFIVGMIVLSLGGIITSALVLRFKQTALKSES